MPRTVSLKSERERKKIAKVLSESLLHVDPNILDIIQFGSSVYEPELARDIDLVITTTTKKDFGLYLDAVSEYETDVGVSVDIVVREPGDPIGDRVALGLMTTSKVIYGDGETLKEAEQAMAAPTFDEVRERLTTVADRALDAALDAPSADSKDQWYRLAYNALFDIARNAVMAHFNTEQTRWGRLRQSLPRPLSERFREIIDTLHVSCAYEGGYPQERAGEEFQRWRRIVSQFIDDLEDASAS